MGVLLFEGAVNLDVNLEVLGALKVLFADMTFEILLIGMGQHMTGIQVRCWI